MNSSLNGALYVPCKVILEMNFKRDFNIAYDCFGDKIM